jgi:hypothetical protein
MSSHGQLIICMPVATAHVKGKRERYISCPAYLFHPTTHQVVAYCAPLWLVGRIWKYVIKLEKPVISSVECMKMHQLLVVDRLEAGKPLHAWFKYLISMCLCMLSWILA